MKPEALEKLLLAPLKIKGVVQNYTWGKGKNSRVAQLSGDKEKHTHYAELWFGAHPKGPSPVVSGGEYRDLFQILKDAAKLENPERFLPSGEVFPFLLKVLSIDRALSIQAHPDRARAQKLHAVDPAHYPDANHKPELAVALTDVCVLHGFREYGAITSELKELKTCAALLQKEGSVRSLFEKLLSLTQEEIEASCNELRMQVEKNDLLARGGKRLRETFLKASADYPRGDIGLFFFVLLNFVELSPGEGVFVGPNTPHAYLSGELLECMANSDNVVRLGLTDKYKDIETLREMLYYESSLPTVIIPLAQGEKSFYRVPAQEFVLHTAALRKDDEIRIKTGRVTVVLALEGMCRVYSSEGEIEVLNAGEALFFSRAVEGVSLKGQGTLAIASEGPDAA